MQIDAAVAELNEAFGEWAEAAEMSFVYVTKEELEGECAGLTSEVCYREGWKGGFNEVT
jgi:hypothetical protein